MARKVIAAVMDISFLKRHDKRTPRNMTISKVKKFLVYDPKMVAPRDGCKEKGSMR